MTIVATTYELSTDPNIVVQVDHFSSSVPDDGRTQRTALTITDLPAGPAQNFANLLTKAQNALSANQTYLAIGSPTQAQAVAQVQALTKDVNGLIYYLLHALLGLSSISGT